MGDTNGTSRFPPDQKDRDAAKEQVARRGRLTRTLRERGYEVARVRTISAPTHVFAPYPAPNRGGCVRCPYPREHAVHKATS